MKKVKFVIYFICSLIVSQSCIKEHIATRFDKLNTAYTLHIKNDTTKVFIKDYFPLIEKINTISSKGYKIISVQDFDTILMIRSDSTDILSSLSISSNGETASIFVINHKAYNLPAKAPFIFTQGYEDGVVSISTNGKVNKFIVLWQNSILNNNYIEFNRLGDFKEKGVLEIKIPKCSKDFDRSYIRIFAANDSTSSNDLLIPLVKGEPITNSEQLTRQDKHGQIIYSLLIDRFFDGNPANTKKINSSDVLPKVDYYGGDLEGVLLKIKSNYFSDLGITTIWLSPIMQNPYDAWGFNKDPKTKFSGYHGYWPIFITKIDKRFGDEKVLKELLEESHKRGINVILDYVAHHMHINSPTLKAHPDWVTAEFTPDGRHNLELWDEFRLTTWFDKHIPSLDLGKKYVYEPLTDSAVLWLKQFDLDGFRHDATKHVPEVYWRTLTKKILKEFPNRSIYQIGETYGSPELIESYVKNGMLDAQFDFNLYDAISKSLIDSLGNFENVSKTIANSLQTYGYHNLMGIITGNHDRPRFISLAGGAVKQDENTKLAGWKRDITVGGEYSYDKLAILNAFIFTVPGIPCIYYGDEYGDPGANDPDNRRWMRFDGYKQKEFELNNNVKKLIAFRKKSMPLNYGDYYPLYVSKDVYAYCRIYLGEIVIIALNKSNEAKDIDLTIPVELSKERTIEIFGKLNFINKNSINLTIKSDSFTIISSNKI